jgi:hypothetical protein
MRPLLAAVFVTLLAPFAALADDTRPPLITEVRATQRGSQVQIEARITDETGVLMATCHHRSKGGRWEAAPMTKGDYGDVFKASFAGSGEIEYWIESSDLLGNGPATHGAAGRPIAIGVGRPAQEAPAKEPAREATPKQRPAPSPAKVAKSGPPVIEHRKPSVALPEGQEVTLRARVRGESPIAFSGVFLRKQGESGPGVRLALTRVEGESYEAKIPSDKARGTVEYLLAAKDQNGLQSFGGDGSPTSWFTVSFKPAPKSVEQPFLFAVNPPVRVHPGRSVTVRAQITGGAQGEEPTVPDKAQVLWRGNDGQDQVTDMQTDPTGGLGGFKAELPPQPGGGALYYQVVACDASGSKCAVDTGGRRKWHAVAVAAAPGSARPAPLEAPSSKAPGSLPE